MEVTVKGKHMEVGEALSGYVQENIAQSVEKFAPRAIDSQVTFSKLGHAFSVDLQLHVGRGVVVMGTGAADDAHQAFDAALSKVERQLSRYKTRLADHHKNSEPVAEPVFAPSYVIEAKEEEAPEAPTIVAEMQTAIATLSVSEAVMRMDLAGLPALMFTNSKHGGLNMVYRRADGHIGWIDPAGNAKTTAAA